MNVYAIEDCVSGLMYYKGCFREEGEWFSIRKAEMILTNLEGSRHCKLVERTLEHDEMGE